MFIKKKETQCTNKMNTTFTNTMLPKKAYKNIVAVPITVTIVASTLAYVTKKNKIFF